MKTKLVLLLILCGMLAASIGFSQNMQEIVLVGGKLQKIAVQRTFSTADAPCWDNGMLFFAGNDSAAPDKSVICRIDPDGTVTLIGQNNGITTAIEPSGRGTYYCAEYEGRRVVEMDKDGKVLRIVADSFDGRRFDGPNGIAVDRSGGMYVSDFRYVPGRELEPNTAGVYYFAPDGARYKLADPFLYPCGIALSTDEKILYVLTGHDQDAGRYVYAFDVTADGNLSNSRRFCTLRLTIRNEAMLLGNNHVNSAWCECEYQDYTATSGAESCAVDEEGNLYIATGQGLGVQVFDPSGRPLGAIERPGVASGCCFGGPDSRTLFISSGDGIYTVKAGFAGIAAGTVEE